MYHRQQDAKFNFMSCHHKETCNYSPRFFPEMVFIIEMKKNIKRSFKTHFFISLTVIYWRENFMKACLLEIYVANLKDESCDKKNR